MLIEFQIQHPHKFTPEVRIERVEYRECDIFQSEIGSTILWKNLNIQETQI